MTAEQIAAMGAWLAAQPPRPPVRPLTAAELQAQDAAETRGELAREAACDVSSSESDFYDLTRCPR